MAASHWGAAACQGGQAVERDGATQAGPGPAQGTAVHQQHQRRLPPAALPGSIWYQERCAEC